MLSRILPALALSGFSLLAHATPVAALYQTHCAACHGEQRQGAMSSAESVPLKPAIWVAGRPC